MPSPLTDVEVRILGSLIEKESTTPDAYPLSLNALVNACNQSSNRDPVMELGEDAVRWAINNLRQQSLVRAVQHSASRVMKYQQLMTETKDLDTRELGAMCVLMLRGPQTTGEIKGRAHRLAEFSTLSDVETTMSGLIARELVVPLPRRPGQKEARYAHLLSGPITGEEGDAEGHAMMTALRGDERIIALEATVQEMRDELSALRTRFEEFTRQFG